MPILRERKQEHAELLLWLFESRIKKTGRFAQVFYAYGYKKKSPNAFAPWCVGEVERSDNQLTRFLGKTVRLSAGL